MKDTLSSLPTGLSPAVADIDLASLRHNVRLLQERAGDARLMGVVKADAYGHGAVPVAEILIDEGVRHLAVATVPEAVRLRLAGIDAFILVFAAPMAAHLPAYAEYGLDVTVPTREIAEEVAGSGLPLRAHVKIDTGMGRIGITPEEAPEVVRILERAEGVTLQALWTHFATADAEDDSFARQQLDLFNRTIAPLRDAAVDIHVANSSALLRLPESYEPYHHALVRTGIAMYGLSSMPGLAESADLRPVMRVRARVAQVKVVPAGFTVSYGRRWTASHPTRIATIGAGYADGYFRRLSNLAEVGINEQRFRVAGTVCMDMFMADLGPPDGAGSDVEEGDSAVLFGAGGPSALELAAWAETIPYEICCAVAPRVRRVYHDKADLPPEKDVSQNIS